MEISLQARRVATRQKKKRTSREILLEQAMRYTSSQTEQMRLVEAVLKAGSVPGTDPVDAATKRRLFVLMHRLVLDRCPLAGPS